MKTYTTMHQLWCLLKQSIRNITLRDILSAISWSDTFHLIESRVCRYIGASF
ncbi:Uncharacterised protein [Halioglobus japonicus]|nr:Uncharacterised protein [Halioglobus japonicus]